MLLKIYCENIVVEFLNCHFFFFYILFFLSFFLSIIHTFFFSYLFFSTTHVYPYIPILSLFFPLLSTFQNLPLSFFLQLSFSTLFFFFFFKFFCLIPTHYPTFSVIRNEERTDGLDGSVSPCLPLRSLCRHAFRFAAAARLPPYHRLSSSPPLGWVRLACYFFLSFFFFFSFFRSCLFWFNFILRIGFCFVFCVWIMWETERMREKKIRRREKELI